MIHQAPAQAASDMQGAAVSIEEKSGFLIDYSTAVGTYQTLNGTAVAGMLFRLDTCRHAVLRLCCM